MTVKQIDKSCRGGSDVIRAIPKPAKGSHKKLSFAAAQKYADDWFAEYIKERDGRCVTRGYRDAPCTDVLECSHVERRVHHATRYDPENAYAQCTSCHRYHHTQSESPFRYAVEYRLGECGVYRLWERAQQVKTYTPYELRDIGDRFKALTFALRKL